MGPLAEFGRAATLPLPSDSAVVEYGPAEAPIFMRRNHSLLPRADHDKLQFQGHGPHSASPHGCAGGRNRGLSVVLARGFPGQNSSNWVSSMAPEKKQSPSPGGEIPDPTPPTKPAKWNPAIASYALPVALGVSMLANLVGVFYFRSFSLGARPAAAHEIPLGNYRFIAEEYEPGQVTEANFALYVELVRQAEEPARRLLETRRQKVRQNVEELLRTAHGGDFNDPALSELKSQIQKRVNETLQIRAVTDVIVNELQMERAQPPNLTAAEPKKAVPWVEPVAGGASPQSGG